MAEQGSGLIDHHFPYCEGGSGPRWRGVLALTALLFCFSSAAQAACTSPAAPEGAMVFNTNGHVLQFCDDTDWQPIATGIGSGNTGPCTNPDRGEGTIVYSSDNNAPQLCTSGDWVTLGPLRPGAGSGGCSTPTRTEGTIVYNVDAKMMQYCDGATWQEMRGPQYDCPGLGDTCPDGTVFAGLTPDGNKRMYVTRCDAGMSWDGSNCTGSRTMEPWNNGNSSGYTTTGAVSDTDGDGNTANLLATDSDSATGGTQPHQNAEECGNLSLNGHDDWYLPAWNEMGVIYTNLVDGIPVDNNPDPVISGFSTAWYRTSSETYDSVADVINMDTGNGDAWSKSASQMIRCARHD